MIFGPPGARVLKAVFIAYCRAGGPTEAGSSAFLTNWNRHLGGRTVGRSGASRLYRVSHSD